MKNDSVAIPLDSMILAARKNDAFAFRNAFKHVMAEKAMTAVDNKSKEIGKVFLKDIGKN